MRGHATVHPGGRRGEQCRTLVRHPAVMPHTKSAKGTKISMQGSRPGRHFCRQWAARNVTSCAAVTNPCPGSYWSPPVFRPVSRAPMTTRSPLTAMDSPKSMPSSLGMVCAPEGGVTNELVSTSPHVCACAAGSPPMSEAAAVKAPASFTLRLSACLSALHVQSP